MAACTLAAGGAWADGPAGAINGEPLSWDRLRAALAETGGAEVLEEAVLGAALDRELAARKLVLPADAANAERRLLIESMVRTARASEQDGELLLKEVRRSRGLGPVRFAGLLERNAKLRAIVRAEAGPEGIPISEDDLRQAYELKHGPRVRARLILVRTQAEAERAMARLGFTPGGEPSGRAAEAFGEVASSMSIDPTGPGGGRIGPVSPMEPTLPVAVRRLLEEMKPGDVSVPVSVEFRGGVTSTGRADETGFAIVKVEERTDGDGTRFEDARSTLEAEVRSVRERAQMDRLARRLVAESRVLVFDESLGWSWDERGPGSPQRRGP